MPPILVCRTLALRALLVLRPLRSYSSASRLNNAQVFLTCGRLSLHMCGRLPSVCMVPAGHQRVSDLGNALREYHDVLSSPLTDFGSCPLFPFNLTVLPEVYRFRLRVPVLTPLLRNKLTLFSINIWPRASFSARLLRFRAPWLLYP